MTSLQNEVLSTVTEASGTVGIASSTGTEDVPLISPFPSTVTEVGSQSPSPTSAPPSMAALAVNEESDDSDTEVIVHSSVTGPPLKTPEETAAIAAMLAPAVESVWVAGKKFTEHPPQLITMTNLIHSKRWYVVSRGLFISVFPSPFIANSATLTVSGGSQGKFKSQEEAVNTFNLALASKALHVVHLDDKRSIFHPSTTATGNMSPSANVPAPLQDGNNSDSSLEITLLHSDSGGNSKYEDARSTFSVESDGGCHSESTAKGTDDALT
ncbi:hypothetical protein EV421DRAFT_1913745 [Armillaria borealis]|uniref:Uncharacterized protein n=1 Tax=Armillaria borealis TaxID=47425 RepID=A0AA39IU52_9AGAR|nr:hypothetical protein EV421DRAFT_1913745 [Armillaria borealis]